MLVTVLFCLALLARAVYAGNYTQFFSNDTSTLIPIVYTDISVVENVLQVIVAFPLLVLSAWIIVVIFVSRALLKSNFVYHVLNLAIADVAVGLGDIVGGIEMVLAPNSWGGLSSAIFSPQWATFGSVISNTGSTQHFLAMAIIAVDRLDSILRPMKYRLRRPPVAIIAVMNIFFASNLVATTCCYTIDGEFTYSEAYNVALSFNEYLGAALVFVTVFVYTGMAIAVHRKKKVSSENVTNKQHFDRQKQLTQTVAKVAIVYVATALTSTVALLVVNQLSNCSLIASGPYDVAYNFLFVLMTVGQYADLNIFAVKIGAIAQPSARYLSKIFRCGRPAQVVQTKRTTGAMPTVGAGPAVPTHDGEIQLASVQI